MVNVTVTIPYICIDPIRVEETENMEGDLKSDALWVHTVLKRPEEHREKLSQLVVFFSSWDVAMLLSNLPRKLNQFEHVNRFQYTSSCHRCFKESIVHTHWSTIVFIVHTWPWSISPHKQTYYIHILGGFNPFEKHISQTGSFPQVGVNMNIF